MGGGQVSAAIDFVVRGITEMGETEALKKAWLVGRCGRRGETPDSGGGVYGHKDDGESYYLPPNQNGDDVPLIGMQTPHRPERGAREPRLRCAGGTGGRDGAGAQ